MQRVFISYRRADTGGYARSVYDRLTHRFGKSRVFRDIGTMPPGIDFVAEIRRQINIADVVIVLIGDEWQTAVDADGRTLNDPANWAHLEIAAALRENVPVVPVLVQNARMPSADRLPPDLAQLAFRNAFELSDRRWEYDIGELVKLLQSFPDRHVASLRTKLAAKRSVALRAVLSTVVVAVGGATIITQCQRNLIGPVLAEPTSGTAVAPSLAVVPTSITTGVPPANSSTAIASSTELGTPAAQLSISHTAWIVASQQLDPVWNQARWPTAIAITQAYQTSYPGAGPTELAEAREKEYAARLNYAGTLQRNGDTAAAVTQLERAQAISDGDLSANATLSALTPTPTPTATSAPATPTPYTFLITSGD